MKSRDFLWCALNLLLDEEEQLEQLCPSCRSRCMEPRCAACGAPLGLSEGSVNGGFDEERFLSLARGERI